MSEIYSFGEWVRRRRRVLDLTQALLAEQVGCAASMIRKIEADERRPSRQVAELLADALQVPAIERDQFLRTARAELAPDQLVPPSDVVTSPPTISAVPKGNLPLALTSFIGRETEIAAIRELLATQRLLTLTGPGGSGKTRLAFEVVAGVQTRFEQGAWIVELASVSDPALVVPTVAALFGLREEAGTDPQTSLVEFLRNRQILLVLDNCEHLVDACARLTEALLRACHQLRILATSREALKVPGEAVYRVPPLRTPDIRQAVSLAVVEQTEAVRLFTERAQSVLPSFVLTHANVNAVAQICVRLDGIPLALELAAARVAMLRVEQIADRLDDRFRLLTGGSRTAVPRQQTLRTLIDWSYELLSEAEQGLLQHLSVFKGGWTLEAAEAVGARSQEDLDVLDLLHALVDKSLVQIERIPGQTTRYRMLETIREYALERLEASGALDDVQRRHAAYFLSWIEANQPYLRGIEQRTWLDELEAEHDNLRAALQWSLSGGDAALGARLAGTLAQWEHGEVSGFWVARGHTAEGQRWLERALDALGNQQPTLQAWTMLHLESFLEHVMTTHSDDLLDRTHTLFLELEDQTGIAHVLLRKAGRLWQKGELTEAQQMAEASMQLFQDSGDLMGVCNARYRLCTIETQNNHLDRARTLIEQCVEFGRANHNFVGTAGDLVALAGIAERQGRYAEAAQHLRESIRLSEQLGEHFQLTWPLHGLGWLALDHVDDGHAFQLLEHHVAEFRNRGLTSYLCVLLPVYGMLNGKRGDLVQARRVLHECVTVVETTGHRRFVCNSVEAGAMLANQSGQPNLSARWLGAESVLIHDPTVQTFNRTHPSIERLLVDTRAGLDPDAFEADWQAGQLLSIEQVIDEILAWTTP